MNIKPNNGVIVFVYYAVSRMQCSVLHISKYVNWWWKYYVGQFCFSWRISKYFIVNDALSPNFEHSMPEWHLLYRVESSQIRRFVCINIDFFEFLNNRISHFGSKHLVCSLSSISYCHANGSITCVRECANVKQVVDGI